MSRATRLDEKLDRIRSDPGGSKDFMICDAKDPDMARGIHALGRVPNGDRGDRAETRQGFLDRIRSVVAHDMVDLVLMSPYNLHRLAVEEGIFANTRVAAAARVNDTTEIWLPRHGAYRASPSRPFRTAEPARVMYGGDVSDGVVRGTDLGLYSVTFNNDVEADERTLAAYRAFRQEANALGFRHFLEVFNPNVGSLERADMAAFVNDCIVRCLAGIDKTAQPQFLKVAYNGPAALEELVGYDDEMIVAVLGGSAWTTRDTFELLSKAKSHGARLALFGRKINQAEAPLDLIEIMHLIAGGDICAEEGVELYHARLESKGISGIRSLDEDRAITDEVLTL